ncbi:MAG TPA: deoxyribose-phosphate aldolase [Conexivisphaerales archaeon]|nr:deoxyribose-phosphate aldolase [Conexivisphaerales archaeon]
MEKVAGWTPESAASIIDQTLLRPNATEEEVTEFCDEAVKFRFCTVCVNPSQVSLAWERVKSSPVRVCSVVSFPFGLSKTDVKVKEALDAVEDGAEEVDMVANIGAEKSHRFDLVFKDAKAVAEAVKKPNRDVVVKAIIETCYLTDEEKESACLALVRSGVDFVKTSTGFGTGGATVHDVALMRRVVGAGVGVKASGGIRDAQAFSAMTTAGANRIGTSHGVEIVKEIATRTAQMARP